MTRRSRREMAFDALKAMSEGRRKPTRIAQYANLCQADTVRLLRELEAESLISKIPVGKRLEYALTEEGRQKLKLYESLDFQNIYRDLP